MDKNTGYYGQNRLVKKQLRDLGIRIDVVRAKSIYDQFKMGATRYSLHTIHPGETMPVVAKNTAYKMHRLYEEGRLSFLGDIDAVKNTFDGVTDSAFIEGEGEGYDFLKAFQPIETERAGIDLRAEQVLSQYESVNWTLREIEEAGIPTIQALEMLERVDMVNEEVRDSGWTISRLIKMLQLYVLFSWYRDDVPEPKDGPPFDLLKQAAACNARGRIEGNLTLARASHDAVRYQIWRAGIHLDTYRRVHNFGTTDSLPRTLRITAFNDFLTMVDAIARQAFDRSAETRMPEKGIPRMPPESAISEQRT